MIKKLMIVFISALLVSCSTPSKKDRISMEKIEIVAAGAKGGGADATVRAIQQVLTEKKVVKVPVSVSNKIGGQGEEGWKYIKQRKEGNIVSGNSSLLITNNLLGQSQLTYKDFTPLAILTSEWEVIVVPVNSPIYNLKQLIRTLNQSESSMKVGISPRLGNDDHLSFMQLNKKAGVDSSKLEFFVYNSSHKVIDALVHHQLDVAPMSLSEVKKQYEQGQVRILAVSSPKRLEELKEIPTWKEAGIDVTFSHWRGLMGPPNMTKEQVAYWNKAVYEMVHTKEWEQLLKDNDLTSFYKNSSGAKVFLEQQSKLYSDLMGGANDE
ncbi:tripartite tricarboxylate transporter substrate binding protein [Priestia aryabhattai]|uniref:tripartite tricarboxylate transporter substrate binding protein n=1 Tax=Priestia aryabhattai TaxID=412384 RepID=UPI0023804DB6|nr:tripartite tricarboxylate transporter substrate-binding protein [Priestia aryabhattai]WDW09814.1 tripartite tricarboxylate transporter substrate-binding protein [Priestia aryabhattai]